MKKPVSLFLFALLAAAVFSTAVEAKMATFTTGRDWVERMSDAEKFMAVVVPMAFFEQAGVPFRERPEDYIVRLERVLLNNPYLENEDVSNILASTVYAYEPESRVPFNQLAATMSESRAYFNEGFFPKLLVAPEGKELRQEVIPE